MPLQPRLGRCWRSQPMTCSMSSNGGLVNGQRLGIELGPMCCLSHLLHHTDSSRSPVLVIRFRVGISGGESSPTTECRRRYTCAISQANATHRAGTSAQQTTLLFESSAYGCCVHDRFTNQCSVGMLQSSRPKPIATRAAGGSYTVFPPCAKSAELSTIW